MEIYLLRDGAQTGPFSQETIRRLLDAKSVAPTDLAWRQGVPQWLPLDDVLQASKEPAANSPATEPAAKASPSVATTPEPSPAPGPAKPADEPTSPKQRALLEYMGIAVPNEMTRERAALLISETMENPKDPARLARWHEDRFRLYPDLFSAELQAKKENRANRFFELAQTIGAKCFVGLAKAHCQVLVGYLDVKYPNWDARETEAAWNYFFPAVAEKFPDLVTKEWRGKLKYPTGPKVATELKNHSAALPQPPSTPSPLWGLVKGLGIGAIVLVIVTEGLRLYRQLPGPEAQKATPAPARIVEKAPGPPLAVTKPAPPAPESVPVADAKPPTLPEAAPTATPQPSDPPAPSTEIPPTAAPAPAPAMASNVPPSATPAAPAPAPTAAAETPQPPAPAPPPTGDSTAGSVPPPPNIVAVKTPSATAKPSGGSDLDALFASPNTPSAAPPAATPSAAPAEAPPATPTAANPPATPAPAAAPAVPKKTSVVLTKAVEVPIPFGKARIPAGTQLPLLAQEGAVVKVNYLNMVVSIPVSSTDFKSDTP